MTQFLLSFPLALDAETVSAQVQSTLNDGLPRDSAYTAYALEPLPKRAVYIVTREGGPGDDLQILGVYLTPAAAMAAHPIPDGYVPVVPGNPAFVERPGWKPCSTAGEWHNGLSADRACYISEHAING